MSEAPKPEGASAAPAAKEAKPESGGAAPPTTDVKPASAVTAPTASPPGGEDAIMSLRPLLFVLVPIALWDLLTTFLGVSMFFDLPTNPDINPGQFAFGIVVTLLIFGFVMATHAIHSMHSSDTPFLILKGAWATAVAIDLYTAWEGTRRIVFYGEEDPVKGVGVAVVAALIVTSTIFLSSLLFGKAGKS